MDGSGYRAFISYSHRDKRWGDWLHRTLESYSPPKHLIGRRTSAGEVPARFAPVFRDRDDLPTASSLSQLIQDALHGSDNLVVICSPAAASSRWVNEEVLVFKRLGKANRIFCLIVAGEPGASAIPGREADECFPVALRYELDDEGQPDPHRPTEPIAADARPEGDGRANARLKLLAGMLGLGFDALKQRELIRKHRRITALASLSVMLAAVMAVLGVQAMIARQAAEVARQAAERRQKQAEGLIGFMLGDLNTKLTQVDRQDILEDVATKAMEYFRALPAADISDAGAEQRVSALEKIGSLRSNQGKAKEALEAFEAARKLSQSLAEQRPDDADRQAAYARTLSWIGKTYWAQGKVDAAANAFSQASTALESAVKRAPGSALLLKALLYEATNTGRILEASGKVEDAKRNYLEVLQVAERLAALQPSDRAARAEVGYAHNNLGVLEATKGNLREALAHYQQDLAIKQSLSDADPRDNAARGDLALSLMFTSKLHGQLGDTRMAIADAQKAAELYTSLLRLDPSQVATTLYSQGLAYRGLANLQLEAGHIGQAKAAATLADAAITRAATADPTDPIKALRSLETRLQLAQAALLAGQLEQAGHAAEQVQAGIAALNVGEAYRPQQARLLALALQVRADAKRSTAPEQALHLYQQAQALLAPHVDDATRDPDMLDPWIRLAIATHARPFPQRNLESLRQSGYASPGFLQAMARAGIAYMSAAKPVAASPH